MKKMIESHSMSKIQKQMRSQHIRSKSGQGNFEKTNKPYQEIHNKPMRDTESLSHDGQNDN